MKGFEKAGGWGKRDQPSRRDDMGSGTQTDKVLRVTLAAATSFMAEVIFLVFFTEPTRSRSSLTLALDTHANPGTSATVKNYW